MCFSKKCCFFSPCLCVNIEILKNRWIRVVPRGARRLNFRTRSNRFDISVFLTGFNLFLKNIVHTRITARCTINNHADGSLNSDVTIIHACSCEFGLVVWSARRRRLWVYIVYVRVRNEVITPFSRVCHPVPSVGTCIFDIFSIFDVIWCARAHVVGNRKPQCFSSRFARFVCSVGDSLHASWYKLKNRHYQHRAVFNARGGLKIIETLIPRFGYSSSARSTLGGEL